MGGREADPEAAWRSASQAGMSEQTFNACLSDQRCSNAMQVEQKRATDKFGVNSNADPVSSTRQEGGRRPCRSRTSPTDRSAADTS